MLEEKAAASFLHDQSVYSFFSSQPHRSQGIFQLSSLTTMLKGNTTSAKGGPPNASTTLLGSLVTSTFLGLAVETPSIVFSLTSCRKALKQHQMPFHPAYNREQEIRCPI